MSVAAKFLPAHQQGKIQGVVVVPSAPGHFIVCVTRKGPQQASAHTEYHTNLFYGG